MKFAPPLRADRGTISGGALPSTTPGHRSAVRKRQRPCDPLRRRDFRETTRESRQVPAMKVLTLVDFHASIGTQQHGKGFRNISQQQACIAVDLFSREQPPTSRCSSLASLGAACRRSAEPIISGRRLSGEYSYHTPRGPVFYMPCSLGGEIITLEDSGSTSDGRVSLPVGQKGAVPAPLTALATVIDHPVGDKRVVAPNLPDLNESLTPCA